MRFIKYFPRDGDIRTREKFLLFPKSVFTQSSKTTYWLCKVVIKERYVEKELRRAKQGYYYYAKEWNIIDISECANTNKTAI